MLAMKDVTVNEDAGSVIFSVTLSKMGVTGSVEVHYATGDGSATQPGDYTTTTGTVIIAVGQTTATFNIPIVDNQEVEGAETFVVNLSSPVNATLADSQAVVTITDNDSAAGQINLYLPMIRR